MNLDPQIAELIDALDAGFPPVHTMTGAEARAVIRSRFVAPAHPEEVGEVRDASVHGPVGDVAVRIYRPASTSGPVPTLVYAHGGGFVFCDLDSHDSLCRSFANLIPAVVVSVEEDRDSPIASAGGRGDIHAPISAGDRSGMERHGLRGRQGTH